MISETIRERTIPEVHRAINIGNLAHEEVIIFIIDKPGVQPQPEA